MSADFSVCVLSRTEKSYNYSVGFRIFLSGYFGTDRIIVIFLCVPRKNTQKNSSPTGQFEFPVVRDSTHLIET